VVPDLQQREGLCRVTVFNAGGSRSATKEIVIAKDDASLLSNPL
jgi:hypothetical protein